MYSTVQRFGAVEVSCACVCLMGIDFFFGGGGDRG